MMPDDQGADIPFPDPFLPHTGGEPGGGPEQRSPGPSVMVPVGNPMDDRLAVRLRVEMAAPVVPDVFRGIDHPAASFFFPTAAIFLVKIRLCFP